MRGDIHHKEDEDSNVMDNRSQRYEGMSGIFFCGTYNKQVAEGKDMREEGNVLIRDRKYTAYMKFPCYVYDVLYKVQERIEAK